jgi:hypothetical protein
MREALKPGRQTNWPLKNTNQNQKASQQVVKTRKSILGFKSNSIRPSSTVLAQFTHGEHESERKPGIQNHLD